MIIHLEYFFKEIRGCVIIQKSNTFSGFLFFKIHVTSWKWCFKLKSITQNKKNRFVAQTPLLLKKKVVKGWEGIIDLIYLNTIFYQLSYLKDYNHDLLLLFQYLVF